ncbi:MAG: ATPase, T2SS/T4P/T4SS family [bacterium]|nr:ATPase, T2SS/T4P/T4SS family [bacterium]
MSSVDSASEIQIQKLLSAVAEYKATDLHLSVGSTPVLRMGGKLVPLTSEPLLTSEFIQTVASLMLTPELNAKLQEQKSILFIYYSKSKARYKVHMYFQGGFISISLRLIPSLATPINGLELPQEVKNLVQVESGMIIVCGPYGSGKSTILAGFIEYYNQNLGKHIVTFEKPVEFLINDSKSIVEQREIGKDINSINQISEFVSTEDVDIVLLADLFNHETMQVAFDAARMGKLVLVEANTDSIRDTLESIIGMYKIDEQPAIIATMVKSLKAIVALESLPNTSGSVSIAAEVLVMTPSVQGLLQQGALEKVDMIIEGGRNEGMISIKEAKEAMAQAGIINLRM